MRYKQFAQLSVSASRFSRFWHAVTPEKYAANGFWKGNLPELPQEDFLQTSFPSITNQPLKQGRSIFDTEYEEYALLSFHCIRSMGV